MLKNSLFKIGCNQINNFIKANEGGKCSNSFWMVDFLINLESISENFISKFLQNYESSSSLSILSLFYFELIFSIFLFFLKHFLKSFVLFTLFLTVGMVESTRDPQKIKLNQKQNHIIDNICLTSVMRAKCGVRSTLCWKVGNISGPT